MCTVWLVALKFVASYSQIGMMAFSPSKCRVAVIKVFSLSSRYLKNFFWVQSRSQFRNVWKPRTVSVTPILREQSSADREVARDIRLSCGDRDVDGVRWIVK